MMGSIDEMIVQNCMDDINKIMLKYNDLQNIILKLLPAGAESIISMRTTRRYGDFVVEYIRHGERARAVAIIPMERVARERNMEYEMKTR